MLQWPSEYAFLALIIARVIRSSYCECLAGRHAAALRQIFGNVSDLRFLISALLIVSGVFPQRCALIVPCIDHESIRRLVHAGPRSTDPARCELTARTTAGRSWQRTSGVCGRACERLAPRCCTSCCTELTLTCQGGSVILPLATHSLRWGLRRSLASTVAGGDALNRQIQSKC